MPRSWSSILRSEVKRYCPYLPSSRIPGRRGDRPRCRELRSARHMPRLGRPVTCSVARTATLRYLIGTSRIRCTVTRYSLCSRRTSTSQDVRFPFGMQFDTLVLQSAVLPKVCYVGRHLGIPGRRDRVVGLIRQRWSQLYTAEQQWFDIFWPACHPEVGDTIPGDPNPEYLSLDPRYLLGRRVVSVNATLNTPTFSSPSDEPDACHLCVEVVGIAAVGLAVRAHAEFLRARVGGSGRAGLRQGRRTPVACSGSVLSRPLRLLLGVLRR